MAENQNETKYTVVILSVPDPSARQNVARGLAQVARNISQDQILKKLDALPWTLTRSATEKRAAKIVDMLQSLGAEMKVIPPLPEDHPDLKVDTEILPGTDLVSESQTIAATQYMPVPPELEESADGIRGDTFAAGSEPPLDRSEGFALEPLSLTGMLDRSFQICRYNFWKLVAIIGIPWFAMIGLIAIGAAAFGFFAAFLSPIAVQSGSPTAWTTAAFILIPIGFVSTLLMLALFYLAQGALIHAVSTVYLGESVRIKQSFSFVLKKLWKFILTSFLLAFVAIALIALPVVFGVMFFMIAESFTSSGWWSAVLWPFLAILPMYTVPKLLLFDKAVIIEDVAYVESLKRSWSLVSGKTEGPWPRTYFMRIIVLLHLYIVISIGISMLFGPLSQIIILVLPKTGIWSAVSLIISQLISACGNIVGTMYFTVCMVVFYYDIRIRKEGFDLRMLTNLHGS